MVIMDMGEVFTALEQGVVDGQDNPLSTVRNEGWYEVQKYIYNTNHIMLHWSCLQATFSGAR